MPVINYDANTKMAGNYPVFQKLGAVNRSGEMTPFVFKGRLMRMELDDPSQGIDKGASRGALIRDVETGQVLSTCAKDGYFHSAYAEDDRVYVLCVDINSPDTIKVYESADLKNWEGRVLFTRPGWAYCNTGLTKGPDGYVLLLECYKPVELVGQKYTFFFATSKDLVTWEFMDNNKCFCRDHYNGGPWMKYVNGWYYVISVTELLYLRYTNYIFRTQDFETWYVGYYNPVLMPDADDKKISPNCTERNEAFYEHVRTHFNINNSDIDMCDWQGKTYINYAVSNQLGSYYMADAIYDGPMAELLERYFV